MTLSLSHDVKQAALSAVLQRLPDVPSYNLFFVVPEDIFTAFGARSYVTARGAKAARWTTACSGSAKRCFACRCAAQPPTRRRRPSTLPCKLRCRDW